MRRARLLIGVAVLLAAAGFARAQPEEGVRSEIQALVELGQRQPEAALDQLAALRAAQGSNLPRLLPEFDFALAQTQLEMGDDAAALLIAQQLAAQAGQVARADLLKALIALREGRVGEAAASARRALDPLEAACGGKAGAEAEPAALRELIRRGCDFRAAAQALLILAREQELRGNQVQAGIHARHALALAEAGRDGVLAVQATGLLAVLEAELGRNDEAQQLMQRAHGLAGSDRPLQLRASVYESMLASRRDDRSGQLRALGDYLRLARELGADSFVAHAQVNLTDYYIHHGDPGRALALGREALPLVQRYKDRRTERTLRHNMAVAQLQLRHVDAARRELAVLDELRRSQGETTPRVSELRELGEAWADAGQPKEAIALFHLERQLTAEANARNREASLRELQLKYDSKREQHDLELLTRDRDIKDRQLANRRLAQQVGIAVAVLLGLSLLLVALMIKRVRDANKRLKASQALLRAQSERDPLTDLANRRHFLAVMEQQQALATPPRALFSGALLMVDIDHFKHVNDEHGHGIGDVVICEVARRLSHAVRSEDLVVRWGGEEFLVFAPDVSPEQLKLLAERVLQSVGATPVDTEDGPLRVTVSIGFAHFPLPPAHLPVHWEQAVNWADMALYVAKAQGRNRAMGIATVNAADTAALSEIEADFEAACSSERVRMEAVLGPAA